MKDNHIPESLDLKPKGNTVVLRPLTVKTISGIVIPEDSQGMRLSEGVVVSVGPSCNNTKVGDTVMYGKHTSSQIKRNGILYALVYESSINCEIDSEVAKKYCKQIKEFAS